MFIIVLLAVKNIELNFLFLARLCVSLTNVEDTLLRRAEYSTPHFNVQIDI